MTVRLASFSSASGGASSSSAAAASAHTGEHRCEYYSRHVPASSYHPCSAHEEEEDCATAYTADASWREVAHWSSFRDAVHRVQGQLSHGGVAGTKKSQRSGGKGRREDATRNAAHSGRPCADSADGSSSPSPREIERDLHLYRRDVESTTATSSRSARTARSEQYLSNYPSPSREAGSYMYSRGVFRRNDDNRRQRQQQQLHSCGSCAIGSIPEGDNEELLGGSSSEDSLDELVQTVLPSPSGGLTDPPTTNTTTTCTTAQEGFSFALKARGDATSASVDAEGGFIPDCIPKSVDADPRRRMVVEPSPLRPHDVEEDEDNDDDEDEDEEEGSSSSSSPVLVPRQSDPNTNNASAAPTGARRRSNNAIRVPRAQPPPPPAIRSSSPYPSVHSAHSSASGTTATDASSSRRSYSTGTASASSSSSYGSSSFDPEHLAEETRQRALESHLAETQLKLALVEAERDEMEFELLKRKK